MNLSKLTFDDLLEVINKSDYSIEKLDDNLYKINGVVCDKKLLDILTQVTYLIHKNKLNESSIKNT